MLKWLRRAERDLEEVENYVAQDNPKAAVDVVLKIILAVERLEHFPGIGRTGRVYSGPFGQDNNAFSLRW